MPKRKREDEDGPEVKKRKMTHDIRTRIFDAIKHDHVDELLKILKENNIESCGTKALSLAISKKKLKIFQSVLSIPDLKYWKSHIFDLVVTIGNKEIAEVFLKHTGLDSRVRLYQPIKYAIYWNKKEILEVLLNDLKDKNLEIDYECLINYIRLIIKKKKENFWDLKNYKIEDISKMYIFLVNYENK